MRPDEFHDLASKAVGSEELATHAEWMHLDHGGTDDYRRLKEKIGGDGRSVVFYLATPPTVFSSILSGLARPGSLTEVTPLGLSSRSRSDRMPPV